MSQTKVVGEMKTHFVLNNFYFGNRAVYEVKLKNVVEPSRSQITTVTCALHAGYLSLQHTQ